VVVGVAVTAVLAAIAVFVLPGPWGDRLLDGFAGPPTAPAFTTSTDPAEVLRSLADIAEAQPPPAQGRYDFVRTMIMSVEPPDEPGGPNPVIRYESRIWKGDDGSARTEEQGLDATTRRYKNDTGEIYGAGEYWDPREQLPTDPVVLRAELLDDPYGPDAAGHMIQVMSGYAGQVYEPQVQAGMLRALADMPGLRFTDGAVDAVGRGGIAVVATVRPPERPGAEAPAAYDIALILDPATGRVLGNETTVLEDGYLTGPAPQVAGRTAVLEAVRVDALGERP
jgi:hypothetical protein